MGHVAEQVFGVGDDLVAGITLDVADLTIQIMSISLLIDLKTKIYRTYEADATRVFLLVGV